MDGNRRKAATSLVHSTEEEKSTSTTDDNNNEKIDQQSEKQQEVDINTREPITQKTQIQDIHDITMYTLKLIIEKSKDNAQDDKEAAYMEALLHDVNQIDKMNGNTKTEGIKIPDTLAHFIGLTKV